MTRATLPRGLRTLAFRHVVYPSALTVAGQRSTYRHLERLRELEWAAPEVVEARRKAQLLALLDHARRGSPHYATTLPARIEPDAPLGAMLQAIPPLDRRTLQTAGDRVRVAAFAGRTTTKTTGGSTGEAVLVRKNADAVARERAGSWLGHGWFGVRPGDRGVRFWGGATTASRRWSAVAADVAMNRTTFPAFAFTEADLRDYWDRCLAIRPVWVYGYASMIAEFAAFLLERGLDGRGIGARLVVSTAEVLGGAQRAAITEAFGAPVQNEYGCGEVGPIAYECPAGTLHVLSDNVIVETVGPNGVRVGPGEAGEILVTDLGNRATPLIRYRIGDFGALGDRCECGRSLPVLDGVWGRAYDFVRDSEGRRYHGEFFMYLFEDLRRRGVEVAQFQVTQRADGALRIDLRAADGTLPADQRPGRGVAETVRREAAARLPGVPVEVRYVAEIPREESGKLRLIVNESESPLARMGR